MILEIEFLGEKASFDDHAMTWICPKYKTFEDILNSYIPEEVYGIDAKYHEPYKEVRGIAAILLQAIEVLGDIKVTRWVPDCLPKEDPDIVT